MGFIIQEQCAFNHNIPCSPKDCAEHCFRMFGYLKSIKREDLFPLFNYNVLLKGRYELIFDEVKDEGYQIKEPKLIKTSLGIEVWVVYNNTIANKLRQDKVRDVIYTEKEVELMKELSREMKSEIHRHKGRFRELTLIEVKNHE